MTTMTAFWRLLTVAVLLGWSTLAAAQAGKVETLRGTAELFAPAQSTGQRMAVGTPFQEGDRIHTGANSQVRLRFGDGTQMELGSNTNMVVERYSLSPEAGQNALSAKVLLGAFRVVTGVIGRRSPQNTLFNVSVATIGIRGTHFGGEVEETSARIMLLDPEERGQANSVEVSNNFGRVVIDKPGFGTEIPDQFSPPSAVRQMQLRQIQDILRAIRIAPPTSAPRPR